MEYNQPSDFVKDVSFDDIAKNKIKKYNLIKFNLIWNTINLARLSKT